MNEPEFPPRRGRPPNIPRPLGASPVMDTELAELSAPTFSVEDPRARAARRALELRDHLGGMDDNVDEFAIDPRVIPDGWTYEWKAKSILNAEQTSYLVNIQHRGWAPVPTSRHPEMMPKENNPSAAIEKKGQILMEIPTEIYLELKARDRQKAFGQVNQKEAQLNNAPQGTFERNNKGAPLATIKKAYGHEPIAVPK